MSLLLTVKGYHLT